MHNRYNEIKPHPVGMQPDEVWVGVTRDHDVCDLTSQLQVPYWPG